MNKRILTLGTCLILIASNAIAKSKTYTIDAEHSDVSFKIKHLVSKVRGSFTKIEGTVEYDAENPSKFKSKGKIETASINTGVAKRDEHLRSADFFDVDNPKQPQNKTITFESIKLNDVAEATGEYRGKLLGKITIHSVTKPIELDLVILGKPMLDPWGMERLSFSATGMLNRKDFGLTWNKAVETGGFVVGDEVELELNVEAITKAEAPKPAKDDKKVMKNADEKQDKK